MLEIIRAQNNVVGFNRVSQSGCEVSLFMKNFFEAVQEGNTEEINSYFADEMEPISVSLKSEISDEVISVDDHIATFSCSLDSDESTKRRLNCVLDKSEGYWQIIFGEIQSEVQSH